MKKPPEDRTTIEQKKLVLPEGYFCHPEGYLWRVLPVEKFTELPQTIKIDELILTKKSEFHVTVINARRLAGEIGQSGLKAIPDIELDLQRLLAEYVSAKPIEFIRFIDDIRLATTRERTSIAARCEMRNLEGYFDLIRSNYNIEPLLQPTHVSIYTATGAAVGIDSKEQMESYKRTELPEVQKILGSVSAGDR